MIQNTAHDLAAIECALLQVNADITELDAKLHNAHATKAYLQARRDTLRTQSQLPVIAWKGAPGWKAATAKKRRKQAAKALAAGTKAEPTKQEMLRDLVELLLQMTGRSMELYEIVDQLLAEKCAEGPPNKLKSAVHAVLNKYTDKFYKVSHGVYDLAAPRLVTVVTEGEQHAGSA